MKHAQAALLSAYLDGETTQEERVQVDAHVGSCSECRFELESLRAAKRALAQAPRRAMPPDLIAAIELRLAAPRRSRWLPVLGRPQFLIPAGVFAAAALAVGLWLGGTNRDPDQYIPLEPLLAAHARYQAEALVSQENTVASSYSSHLNAYYSDGADQEQ